MTPARIQRYILLLSVVLFIGKICAWYITHSVTVLTDALESTVNVLAGAIGLYSIILANKPRDIDHPYGHGKAEFVSSAVEGALIFIAGLLIIYQSTFQLLRPKELHKLDIGIYITGATGLLNFLLGTYAVQQGRKQRSLIVESAGKHLKSDAYSTLGIIVGLGLLMITGWVWLDSVVAMVFALFIIYTGYNVVRRSLSGIMDEADMQQLQNVIELLQKNRKYDWVDLHNLRVVEFGERMHVDAHLTLPWYYDVRKADEEIHALEDMIRNYFNDRVEVFIHVDACQPYSCKLCAKFDCHVRQHPFVAQVEWTVDNVFLDSKHGKEVV